MCQKSTLAQWNLLDFFLLLVIALAIGRLWGRSWGAIALAALVLSYQEAGAPIYEWIVLLAAVALHRALPAGRVRNASGWIRQISLLVLVLITLGFATDQVRMALYPVLEQGAYFDAGEAGGSAQQFEPAPVAAAPIFEADETKEIADAPGEEIERMPLAPKLSARMLSSSSPLKPEIARKQMQKRQYQSVDPDAKVQTGPGLPNWRWHEYRISWDGPVRQDQELNLWLLSPIANKALVILRIVLFALLLVRVSEFRRGSHRAGSSGASGKARLTAARLASVVVLSAFVCATALHSRPAQAEQSALPSQELLEQLREKLTRPADCLPTCAEIARLSVVVDGSTLHLGLDVDAAVDTALPLPGGAKHWRPSEARLDGKLAYLHRDPEGGLWLLTPAGQHRVELTGTLPAADVLQLPLPLRPRNVEVSAEGWEVAGISDESGVADTLQLSRQVKAGNTTQAPALPPFLRLERRLILDLEWRVETTVYRDSPGGVPALVQIPLLPGEAVTTPGINVQDGKVLVNLGPQAESLSWSANLAQRSDLELVAPDDDAWVETWIIAAAPLWHVSADGIPPIAIDAGDDADLAFKPWPGEKLMLNIERPQALAGQTLTIDRSDLRVTPGTRTADYQLSLNLRSSRGVDHALTLPDGADLQQVSINGQPRPIRANGRQLVLPLTPGKQAIEIAWRVDQEMAPSYATTEVNLGQESVNSRLALKLPYDRWLLLASGPGIGPAILFWGKLLVLLAAALALGRFGGLPIKTRQWVLLALGLTQVEWWAAALVIAWFYAFSHRAGSTAEKSHRWLFNLRQVALVLLSFALFGVLFSAVQGGLLGHPDMQVVGNNSSYGQLNWYVDRTDAELRGAWVLTLPILVYRGLMLAWALWLAWSLLAWLKWGWNAFGQGDLWRRKPKLATSTTDETQSTQD